MCCEIVEQVNVWKRKSYISEVSVRVFCLITFGVTMSEKRSRVANMAMSHAKHQERKARWSDEDTRQDRDFPGKRLRGYLVQCDLGQRNNKEFTQVA